MASNAKSTAPTQTIDRRLAFTIERARVMAPTHGCADKISSRFALVSSLRTLLGLIG